MKSRLSIFIIGLITTLSSFASIIVHGDSTTAPFGFTTPVVVKAYDPHSGVFYCGIESPSDTFSLAKAFRPSQSTIAKFVGIGTDDILNDETLEFLTIMPAQTDCSQQSNNPLLALVITSSDYFTQTAVTVSTTDGTSVVTSDDLNDAAEFTTSGICNIAASSCFITAAVRPNEGIFGDLDSGIALVGVEASPLTLFTLDAYTGTPGNRAVLFDGSIPPLKGDSGGNDVIFSNEIEDINEVAMYYDAVLNRFYIGVRIATDDDANDIGKAVVVARTNQYEKNQLELIPIVEDSALEPTADEIIVAQGAEINLRALDLGVMHCSTGPDYLIVYGGIGFTDEVGDAIYALPLVNNPCNELEHGTLADANSELSSEGLHSFITPATEPGDLLSSNDVRAQVGAGLLPIEPFYSISDMVIVGDAVYVSINLTPECGDVLEEITDTGIFYSQALFDATGRIARWTPWKRATPFNAFPGVTLEACICHDGPVKFFDIDAKTGSAWIVEGTTERFVGYTTWTNGTCQNGLIKQVSEKLCNGSYSVLDLNQHTRGFDATPYRYALFGGVDRVAIARVSEACVEDPFGPEVLQTNFSCCSNMFLSTLPDFEEDPCPMGAGCVTSLEYSRRTQEEGDQNYFFAGTETGLYAFSIDGAGFNVNQLDALDEEPFISGSWSLIHRIEGAVIDIKTSGKKLYVLTMNHSAEQPFINTLYSIPYKKTVKAMFHPNNISVIAQNKVGVFKDVSAFFAISIISTGDVDDDLLAAEKEQLVLATSNGLYTSNARQNGRNGIIDATNQTQARWERVDQTEGVSFDGIGFVDTPIKHTVWPLSIANMCSCNTFDRSNLDQLSGTGNMDGSMSEIGEFEPFSFNACSCIDNFNTLYPITYFWSDGGRRFFVINRTTQCSCGTQLAVLPFEVTKWNIQQFSPLFNAILGQQKQINWVRNIGATGLVLAGTNRGVVGLE